MAHIEILLPKMGESVAEATIIKWLKKEGDAVAADEAMVEIATDKVDSEVPAPQDGILLKRLVNDGDVVKVGQPIAHIGTAADAKAQAGSCGTGRHVQWQRQACSARSCTCTDHRIRSSRAARSKGRRERKILQPARAQHRPKRRPQHVRTGSHRRLRYGRKGHQEGRARLLAEPRRGPCSCPCSCRCPCSAPAPTPAASAEPAAKSGTSFQPGPGDEIIEMDRMRRLIADHMVMSKRTSPHVTSFVEADVTNLVMWREKVKKAFEQREGEKLTYTPVFIMAIVQAIKEMPMVNVQVDGYTILRKRDINIGMAAAMPNGNLIVPVIKNADQLNLVGIAKKVNDLANRARLGKLLPDEVSGGTYTVTNVGTFGNVLGTPVINQPQVAIMATGAIRKKPAVIETPQGDLIGIRHMMFLSHSYDHRVVDGALGGRFVRRVADILEAWSVDQEF